MRHLPLNRRSFLTLSGSAALGAFTPVARACPGLEKPDPLKGQKAAAGAINGFAVDLYRQLAGPKSTEKGNFFLSPFSIETALAMTSAGALGKTLEEMEKVLHLPPDPHKAMGELIQRLNATGLDKLRPYELSTANAIWGQEGYLWNRGFFDTARRHYGAGVIEVDFAKSDAARKRINEWVEKATKEKIKELIRPGVITAVTRMVLANAIYFKSKWLHQFDKKRTYEASFICDDGTKVGLPLMSLEGDLNYGEFTMFVRRAGETVQVLELPYAGKELSMLVFLPKEAGGVHRLAQWLTADLLAGVKLKPADVLVFLPRFKAESYISLNPALADMGMKCAFSASGADFTGLSSNGKELFISHVLHKAVVDVSEEGTEAAAATAVLLEPKASEKIFRADRPFAFAIRDNATSATLFLGRYLCPAK